MKSAFEMSRVEATRPPTLTCALLENSTPAELTMKTRPLAFNAPEMTLVSLPMTRLRATAELFGWTKLTVSLGAIEKPCQLMTVDCDDWLMLVVVPLCAMLAEPATTVPPFGSASAGRSSAIRAAMAVIVANGPCNSRSRFERDKDRCGRSNRFVSEPRNPDITQLPPPH